MQIFSFPYHRLEFYGGCLVSGTAYHWRAPAIHPSFLLEPMFAHLFSFLYCIFCLSMCCVLCALLPVSLDCTLWIATSVFSYVYLHHLFTQFVQCTESVHHNFSTLSRMEHEIPSKHMISHQSFWRKHVLSFMMLFIFEYIYIYVIETEGANSLELFCLSGL